MPSLTHDEAVARAALINVDSYEIDLDLTGDDPGAGYGSTTVIRFGSADPAAGTFAEVRAKEVHAVTLNGAALDPSSIVDNRILLDGLAASNELVVEATMEYSTNGEGLHRFVDPEDGEVYLYAMAGLDNAPRIFACFDQPDIKAPITLTVDAPADWTVWANGDGTRRADGKVAFTPTEPISTYLMTLVAGRYHVILAEHDGVPLGLLSRRALAAHLDEQAEELFAITRACFDWYHEHFGVRYPFGNYFQAFVPEFNWGAVENPGCVNFRDEFLFRGAVTTTQRQDRAVVIAHEMAHMWFGDLVTLRWWDDIWLNESFAEYMGWRVAVEATEFTGAWTGFAVGRKGWGYAADQRPSTHPVAPEGVNDTAGALSNFDGISYAKGASVLKQLVEWLGDEPFLAGLRDYFQTHAFGNATLADLLAALSKAADRDLSAWSTAWLRRAQVNTLRPRTVIENGRYREVTIVQTAPEEYPTLRPHRIGAAVYRLDGDGVTATRVTVDVQDTAETPVPALNGEAAGLLVLNDGDHTFAKIRFDDHGRALLPELLPVLDDALARALIWSAVTDASRDADLSAPEALALILAGLPTETDTSVFEDLARYITGSLTSRFLAPEARPEAAASLVDACDKAMDAAEPGGARQLAAARLLIACTEDGERLSGWLAGNAPEGLALDTDLRWAVLYRLVVLGHADEAAIAAEAGRDPSAQGTEWAARIRAALPTPEAKAEAWRLLTGGEQVSGRIALSIADGFWHPEQTEVCAPYVERYFTEIPAIFGLLSPQVGTAVVRSAYPSCVVSEATAVAAGKLLGDEPLPPALRRTLIDATDELRRALAVRNTP
ncbi:aminopeptidase N [Phytomonospora endophytica]|uniref:Aminopeptidase N n=1 Tax=Phytomonospora endophytica TaxID=714109 RepID=A0A841FI61_9ACTN|nr:aminopeptidase N [Phytomonospora endophytica]MBB6035896.1 aminopeptidase N [Phytomonospora endophytica]GIG71108.1 aminopeptidase [Phytomonospora endophytica]